jgi:hypothetical protein
MPEPARSSPGRAISRSDWSLAAISQRQRGFRLLRLHARRATFILAPTTSTISIHLLCLSQTTLRASYTAPVILNSLSLLVFCSAIRQRALTADICENRLLTDTFTGSTAGQLSATSYSLLPIATSLAPASRLPARDVSL